MIIMKFPLLVNSGVELTSRGVKRVHYTTHKEQHEEA
jgi:hypothetical protein